MCRLLLPGVRAALVFQEIVHIPCSRLVRKRTFWYMRGGPSSAQRCFCPLESRWSPVGETGAMLHTSLSQDSEIWRVLTSTTGVRHATQGRGRGGGGGQSIPLAPPPLCDIPSGCCSFTGPWTVTRSSLRMLRRVATFCRPLRPVLLLVSFPRSRSPVVGVLGLC